MMHDFALHDEMTDGAASIKFMMALTEELTNRNFKGLKYVTHDHLINIVWTLIYHETMVNEKNKSEGRKVSTDINPVIPKLLTHLYNYQRDTPLTKIEQLELFQIKNWIDT